MSTWILVIWIYGFHAIHNGQPVTIEYPTEASCMKAAKETDQFYRNKEKTSRFEAGEHSPRSISHCIEKPKQ